jgi:hypothetical protein
MEAIPQELMQTFINDLSNGQQLPSCVGTNALLVCTDKSNPSDRDWCRCMHNAGRRRFAVPGYGIAKPPAMTADLVNLANFDALQLF